MPADSLEKLLVTKYGVPEKQARNYAAQIIAGGAGGHGDALKSEALTNVASKEQMRMTEMAEWAEILARREAGEELPPEYTAGLDEAVADSADQTWQNAMNAPGPQMPTVQVTPPNMVQNMRTDLSGKRPFGQDQLLPLEPPDPYAERLKRATQARQAMLGH